MAKYINVVFFYFSMESQISVGNVLDKLLDGGIEPDVITAIYGPSASGKTNLCLMAAISVARSGKKVIFVDTEGGFSPIRLKQLSGDEADKMMSNIIFLKPTTFSEQKDDIEKLKELVNDKIGLIIVDTISMLYRLEKGKAEFISDINTELGQQIGALLEIARKKNIPVILTSQVYSDFENKNKVNMVGGDLVKYSSKCLIEVQNGNKIRRAVLKKHRHLPEDREVFFEIKEEGLYEKENK